MKYAKAILFVLFAMFAASCLVLFFLPRSWAGHNQATDSMGLGTISIVRHYDMVHSISFLLAIVFIVLAIVSLKAHRIPFRWALWLMPLLVYPVSCAKSVVTNLGPWTQYGVVSDSTGNVYQFLDSSFLQGQLMAIGRLDERSWFLDQYKVLSSTFGDSPRMHLQIVRPNTAQDTYGQLCLTEDNWLVGLRIGNQMYMAFDLDSQKSYVWDDVMVLSPFLLLGPETILHEGDCQRLRNIGMGRDIGQPHPDVVKEALDDQNPGIRALAEQLLSDGDDL